MNKAAPETAQQAPSPRELMRARHPDLFSDSVVQSEPVLARPVFDHHLDTLTARKEEYQFEHFCRLIAEKEICPNLRIQTGPTGGGDSKVDSENYPVAKEISERWWFGEPAGGSERWAFAFSAKKKWKPKLEADVESVLSTKRDYKRIYFFTNQLVSDKLRASTEDLKCRHSVMDDVSHDAGGHPQLPGNARLGQPQTLEAIADFQCIHGSR